MPKVYLAGPIAGKTYEETTEWRTVAGAYLSQFDIEAFSPMRGKDFLRGERITADVYDKVVASDKGIVARDHYDVLHSDVLIVNLEDAEYVSCGTPAEMAWAYDHHIPTIVVMPDNNPYNHPFTRVFSNFTVDNLQDALEIAVSILTPEKFDAR